MLRPRLELLEQETIKRVVAEAYELLWDPGVRIHSDEALGLLADAGATHSTSRLWRAKPDGEFAGRRGKSSRDER